LFEPWRRGAVALQPVWSWPGGRWGEPVAVPASPVVILDGVGLASRRLRERAALTIWVEADSAVRLERVLARDGEALRAEMTTWQRDEHQWFALDATREACDVHVTGTAQGASPDVR
jgi:uridine kinase